jgi:hypothetical protein
MASSPVSTTPQLYSLLGDDLAASFVRRVFAAKGWDHDTGAEYFNALLNTTSLQLDVFILEKLSPLNIEKLYVLKASNAPQTLITNFLSETIPNLNAQLIAFFNELFEKVSKKNN